MKNSLENISYFNWRDVLIPKEDCGRDFIAALDKHFSMYAAIPLTKKEGEKTVIGDIPCIQCGDIQNSGLMGAVMGTGFEWGLQHGEGRCKGCGWPATLYHFVRDKNGKEVLTLRGFLLQYHPDNVTAKHKKTA